MNYMSSTGKSPTWENLLPPVEEEINEYHFKRFFEVMFLRQEVWYKKNFLKLSPPWSDNEFLRDYKFENVYRELDRNSQWEIKNIIMNTELSDMDKIFQIIFFRMVNQPDFFEFYRKFADFKFPFPTRSEFDSEIFFKALQKYRSETGNPYTSAYLINTMCCPGRKRDDCFANTIIPTLKKSISGVYIQLKKSKEPEEFIKKLEELPSVAGFVSHEIYISLCYFAKYTESTFFPWDENDYTNVGPGASLGIRLIFPSTDSAGQKERIYDLRDISWDMLKRYPFKYVSWDKEKKEYKVETGKKAHNITLHQIEFHLCGYQKYFKMENGVGKQRSKYDWKKYLK